MPRDRGRRVCRVAAGVGVMGVAAGGVAAGPLTPPAGPVAPTHKTLTEVEPRVAISAANTPGDADSVFRITQPGSYYLTGNVVGVAGKQGIEIASGDVSVDLNGFAVRGVAGSLDGVGCSAPVSGMRVHNGTVSGWGGSGIDLSTPGAEGSIVEGVVSSGNGAVGIRTSGHGVIRGCVARGNGDRGLIVFDGGVVDASRADENGSDGIATGQGTVVTGCVTRDNAGEGILVSDGSGVHGCVAYSNTGAGIAAGGAGCVISGCSVVSNTLDGITVTSGCLVTGNTARSNGAGTGIGAGVTATGSDNRIEGNLCTAGDFGVRVTGSGNIIVRNTCSGSATNWEIAGNNYYGPIVNRAGVLTVAVSGSAAAGVLATTDPHANFTY